MKQTLAFALALALALAALSGCGGQTAAKAASDAAVAVDVDLAGMSATMVYAEVSNMMYDPQAYVGKTVRMRGKGYSSYYDVTDTTYHSVIIADATACCAQGIEYVLEQGEYPQNEEEVTITGTFELYEEMGLSYCRLAAARREA